MNPLFNESLKDLAGATNVSPDQIEGTLKIPLIGIVPHLERRKALKKTANASLRKVNPDGRWRSRLLTNFPSPSTIQEIYEAILKQVVVDPQESGLKRVFMVVGTTASEGATTTATNIGLAAAAAGIPTVIVEAHNRTSRLSRAFNLKLEPGLSAILDQNEPLSKVLQTTDIPDLSIITVGRPVHYPAKMWESPAFAALLQQLRESYRLVLLEAAPVSDYPDAALLAQKADGVIFVHHFGKTPVESFKKAVERIEAQQKSILGVILNDAS